MLQLKIKHYMANGAGVIFIYSVLVLAFMFSLSQAIAAEPCVEAAFVCDGTQASQAKTWGMPNFVPITALLKEEGLQVHKSRNSARLLISARGTPSDVHPVISVKLVEKLEQLGFRESQDQTSRVFIRNQEMIVIANHFDGEPEVSVAYLKTTPSQPLANMFDDTSVVVQQ